MPDRVPDREELKARLTPEQFHVTQEKGTERPFTGRYYRTSDKGTYSCVCCGQELFSSDAKYDAGCGWPSFWLPLAGDRVQTHRDLSHGMVRTRSPAPAAAPISATSSRTDRSRPGCATA